MVNATLVALVKMELGMTRATEVGRYHQVVFIWMKDPETFSRYVELLRPLVEPYGGALERMLVPEAIHGEGHGPAGHRQQRLLRQP